MKTFAVIETGGKQYRVESGSKIKVEKLEAEAGSDISFDSVLLVAKGDDVVVGDPQVKGAQVSGKVLRQGRDEKKLVFKYHSKTRYKKKKGHRQPFTEIEITDIKS